VTVIEALDYAGRGWPVFPLWWPSGRRCACPRGGGCSSPGKHPLTKDGFKDATTDIDAILTWWARWPDANIGLPTGLAFDVLDVDSDEALDLVDALGDTTCGGPMVRTGRGWQFLFAPTGSGNRAGLIAGVDWRRIGGYVVAPPSMHVCGRRYAWHHEGPNTPLEAPPAAVAALIEPPIRRSRTAPSTALARRETPYSGLIAAVATAPDGKRNDVLN
jgi:hypothetical protein